MKNSKSFLSGMLVVPMAIIGLGFAIAGEVNLPHEFAPGTPARAVEVNANFQAVKAAVDDNNNRIGGLENAPKAINQSVMTTVRFNGLGAGNHTIAIFVRGDCNEVLLNRGNFDQQLLVQEGSGTPTHIDYAGEDIDTTIEFDEELLRTIGTYNKATNSSVPLFVTWKAHAHISGFEGTFADFQVRVDGNEGEPGSRVVMFIGR